MDIRITLSRPTVKAMQQRLQQAYEGAAGIPAQRQRCGRPACALGRASGAAGRGSGVHAAHAGDDRHAVDGDDLVLELEIPGVEFSFHSWHVSLVQIVVGR